MREMPGFEANDLLGWIAAVGALRLLGEVTDGAARLSWRRHGGGWRLVALDAGEPAATAGQAHAWIAGAASAWDWGGFDNVNFGPGEWSTAGRTSRGLAAELWVALGSDGCVRRDGRIEASRLEYAQGGGWQHWLASLRGAVRRVAEGAITAEDMRRVLWGDWRREDLGLICRWDWRCERDHALMAADPTSREMLMRQDHAATVLAAVGLASLPTAATARGLVGALASQHDGETACWPVWQVPLGIADVEALVCSPALLRFAGAASARELAARGVGAVMTARRWYAGKLIVFGRGRELVRT
jgi:hypothetical protein